MTVRLDREARLASGLATQAAYEAVLDEMATLRVQKVLAYGESRYADPDMWRSLVLLYADLHRKCQRVEAWFERFGKGPMVEMPGESIRDTFLDLGNYAVMGVQVLDHFQAFQSMPQ